MEVLIWIAEQLAKEIAALAKRIGDILWPSPSRRGVLSVSYRVLCQPS
jgi:hypothetical protein